ncbi:MAG: helix-turn-helix transcriptional regulator [Pseudomonadota bacterium]|nr:helix-turn-helix transcriptional regulator [Pseudomonadota bacterium]
MTRRLAAATEITPHAHPWAQLAVAASGVLQITAGAATYLVPAWRAVWIPPGVEHLVNAVEAADMRAIYIHNPEGGAVPSPASERGPGWSHCRVLQVSPLLRELILQMDPHGDDEPPPTADTLAREALLGALLQDELQRAAPVRLGIELPRDRRLRRLCDAMLIEPTRHAALADWASEAGASPRTVARLFRDELGTSFQRWREQVLLGHAMTLAARGWPMRRIGAELGYANASAFGAMVRRSVGVSPARFFGGSFGGNLDKLRTNITP